MSRTALITGGTRGIGAATARLLAKRGYALCINYRHNHAAAEALLAELSGQGTKVIAVQADVSVEAEVIGLFDTLDRELGPLAALVNNAGRLQPQTRLADMSGERISRMFGDNALSQFLCCREAVRRMARDRGGRGGAIVNVSSAASYTGAPGEYVDYAAAKAAVDALTRGLSLEMADQGVRVNAVRPGCIHTDIHADGGEPGRVERLKDRIPMKRGGEPEEVAAAIAWLLSDEASYATGTFIDLAGGR
ncbi:SDR family oxidoreductase [Gallaecimonas sp. GXIMD4217]|uniref:SDR family oxidoreductase n=1 Tax=Gallaecimonas sp. GXIMD4217 TaxID=3131927 RepID=UPI00311AC9D3